MDDDMKIVAELVALALGMEPVNVIDLLDEEDSDLPPITHYPPFHIH